MSQPLALNQDLWQYEAEIAVHDGQDFFTEERLDVARVVCRYPPAHEIILLASRTNGDWFPTWIGPVGGAVRMPPGFTLPAEISAAIAAASSSVPPDPEESK